MSQLQQRKDDHLRICLEEEVDSGTTTGFANLRLEYDALPEIDLDDVDLSVEFLGKTLKAPILIGSMTGGSDWAGTLNLRIARVAAKFGLGMALGSQRAMLKHPDTTPSFAVREEAPDLPLLLGNIGAVQLNYGVTHNDLNTLVEGGWSLLPPQPPPRSHPARRRHPVQGPPHPNEGSHGSHAVSLSGERGRGRNLRTQRT